MSQSNSFTPVGPLYTPSCCATPLKLARARGGVLLSSTPPEQVSGFSVSGIADGASTPAVARSDSLLSDRTLGAPSTDGRQVVRDCVDRILGREQDASQGTARDLQAIKRSLVELHELIKDRRQFIASSRASGLGLPSKWSSEPARTPSRLADVSDVAAPQQRRSATPPDLFPRPVLRLSAFTSAPNASSLQGSRLTPVAVPFYSGSRPSSVATPPSDQADGASRKLTESVDEDSVIEEFLRISEIGVSDSPVPSKRGSSSGSSSRVSAKRASQADKPGHTVYTSAPVRASVPYTGAADTAWGYLGGKANKEEPSFKQMDPARRSTVATRVDYASTRLQKTRDVYVQTEISGEIVATGRVEKLVQSIESTKLVATKRWSFPQSVMLGAPIESQSQSQSQSQSRVLESSTLEPKRGSTPAAAVQVGEIRPISKYTVAITSTNAADETTVTASRVLRVKDIPVIVRKLFQGSTADETKIDCWIQHCLSFCRFRSEEELGDSVIKWWRVVQNIDLNHDLPPV